MKLAKRAGFTLIELLVVVLIVGILASIAIPQYFKVVEKSRVSEAMSLIGAIRSAQERYLASHGTYASQFTKLDISYNDTTEAQVKQKYYTATMTVGSNSSGYTYNMVLTRHTENSAVSPRYGLYSIALNIPTAPTPSINSCPGGETCTDDLMQ